VPDAEARDVEGLAREYDEQIVAAMAEELCTQAPEAFISAIPPDDGCPELALTFGRAPGRSEVGDHRRRRALRLLHVHRPRRPP
jgi:hypothetical protein